LKTVLEGEICRKRYRGGLRMEYMGQIMKDVKTNNSEGMKCVAEQRVDWITATDQSMTG
jgi:hypothetical protein